MDRRLAQGPPASPAEPPTAPLGERFPAILIGIGLVVLAALVYWASGPDRFYNHFVWQAAAFLDGRFAIDYPVGPVAGTPGNAFFQDVLLVAGPDGLPNGLGLIPFPPLPAIVLMPLVAIWGLATDQRILSVGLGAIDVGLCWWMLGRLGIGPAIRLATTAFFGFGTVFWYAAQLGTTWYLAHIVALAPALLAVGLALGGDPGADDDVRPRSGPWPERLAEDLRRGLRDPRSMLDRRQFSAGLLLGLAATARLSIAFGIPFLILVGARGGWVRRGFSAGLGAAIPIGLLLLYNLATTGALIHPGYEVLYRAEAYGYPTLGYNPDWAIEDIRYLPQNLAIALAAVPDIAPSHLPGALGPAARVCVETTVRGLFDLECPIATPRPIAMSLLLTSPAYLLVLPALARFGRSRLVTGAALAVLVIGVFNLMHFSQGWVQFGYRFSNDFVAFALPLVAIGMRGRVGALAAGLIGVSVVVNLWGVIWGNLLGW